MANFSINNGNSATFTDPSGSTGVVIDFATLDNSFSLQINGVDLFVGGPASAPNELQFQIPATSGQTVRFADGTLYEVNTPAVWQLGNSNGEPIVRLEIEPDGTAQLYGVKFNNGPLEPLELFNGLTLNSAAIDAAWNDNGTNTIVIDQVRTGPTNAAGAFVDVLCFAAGTQIKTPKGTRQIDDLRAGDAVETFDEGPQTLRWINSTWVSAARLHAEPRLHPILIRADALGPGFPNADLTVSPQHRVLVSSAIAQRMFGTRDVLIPANKLLPLPGVSLHPTDAKGVRYFHMLFDAHQIVWSNGTPTESLFTGPEALKAVPVEARHELLTLFPDLYDPTFAPPAARLIPDRGKLMRKLVDRHRANNKPIYSTA